MKKISSNQNGLAIVKNAPYVTLQIQSKLDPLTLKCMSNLHNILDQAQNFTTKTRFELESNPTIFIKKRLWMKEIWHTEVAVIQNVEFKHITAPLGVSIKRATQAGTTNRSYVVLWIPSSQMLDVHES